MRKDDVNSIHDYAIIRENALNDSTKFSGYDAKADGNFN
jgi:hypothetical protein